jgi:hypothetical protein
MTKYSDSYKAVFDQVKAALQTVTTIKTMVLGEQFRVQELPMAIISPDLTDIDQAAFGNMLDNNIRISVVILIRETEPANWFTDIVPIMGDVVDKILADRTLSSTVRDAIPTMFHPGEITTGGKLYYGGVVRFRALMFFTP